MATQKQTALTGRSISVPPAYARLPLAIPNLPVPIGRPGQVGGSLAFLLGLCLYLFTGTAIQAQHHSSGKAAATGETSSLQFSSVLGQKLRDPALQPYYLQSQLMLVPPAFHDTVAHRHEGELFGYVLEGSVEVQLAKEPLTRYQAGQMFYEPMGVLHQVLRNPHPSQPAKVLLLFIIREGRQAYRREYAGVKDR